MWTSFSLVAELQHVLLQAGCKSNSRDTRLNFVVLRVP
jgi:hypothetical protein